MAGDAAMAAGQLRADWRRIEQVWEESADGWNDQVRAAFATRYWTTIAAESVVYLGLLESLAEILAEAKRQVQ